jgi:hypothetical protein
VEKELLGDLSSVPGKKGIFLKMANAVLDHPDEVVRDAVWPAVPGGEKTLRTLVKELMAGSRVIRERIRYQLRGSYTHYYRRMLGPVLAALNFKCNNTAYRSVMNAIDLLAGYAGVDAKVKVYAPEATVPIEGVVPKAWQDAVTDEKGRIERIPYELCVLIALREALRRREIWVQGAGRWRNPEEDLPENFEDNRDVHYAALGKPLRAQEFVDDLKRRHRAALDRLNTAMTKGTTGGVRLTARRGQSWISVPTLEKLPEPTNLGAIKAEVQRRWGTIDLLDILKNTDFFTEFTTEFVSVATREALPKGRAPAAPADVPVRTGHEHGHPADGGHWRARRGRGRAASGAGQPHHPREPAAGDRDGRQRHLRRPRPTLVGQGDHHRERLQAVRLVGLQPDDPVPRPVRLERDHDLLACGEGPRVHLFAGQELFLLGGRGDDRGVVAALHGRGDRGELHRHAWRQRGWFRVHRTARVPAAAAVEEHRRDQALQPPTTRRAPGWRWRR